MVGSSDLLTSETPFIPLQLRGYMIQDMIRSHADGLKDSEKIDGVPLLTLLGLFGLKE